MSKRGLPANIQMRHDSHYVEELASQSPSPIGRLISIDSLEPNPEQPRVEIGDLDDLTSSIREKGVLEPLLVRPSANRSVWMIIAGERRWRAAKAAGLREVPCVEMDVDERSVAEIALIENLQRKDLTPWEEADGLIALCHRYGYTHEDLARKVGKSRSSVTESLALASVPEEIREECRRADIHVKSLLLQVVRQPDEESMRGIIKDISQRNRMKGAAGVLERERKGDENETRNKQSKFKYSLPDFKVQFEVRFINIDSEVGKADVLSALKALIAELEE